MGSPAGNKFRLKLGFCPNEGGGGSDPIITFWIIYSKLLIMQNKITYFFPFGESQLSGLGGSSRLGQNLNFNQKFVSMAPLSLEYKSSISLWISVDGHLSEYNRLTILILFPAAQTTKLFSHYKAFPFPRLKKIMFICNRESLWWSKHLWLESHVLLWLPQ